MVSPYPPYRDGIANYAVQEVAAQRRAGHDVEVLSPLPSAAHHHLSLPSTKSMWALADMARRYDRVVVQFHPDLFFAPWWGPAHRQAVWAAFALMATRTDLELRIHEIDYTSSRLRGAVRRFALARAGSVVVHTAAERQSCIDSFGLPPEAVTVIDHGSSFTARTTMSRAEARAELGIPEDVPVFVSIGFVQPHKGFDRAVRAFGRIDGDARLYVVGDTRLDEPAWVQYCDDLEQLIERTPGAEMRRGYVSDEHFDLWIAAADQVVLPYRHIWSSSVVERAGILGTPAIVTAVGGLGQQVHVGGTVVADDDELAAAMAVAAGATLRPAVSTAMPTRAQIQERISGTSMPAAGRATSTGARTGARSRPAGAGRSLAVRRLASTPRAEPRSANPVNAQLKKVVHRLARWMVEPIAEHLDGTIRAVSADIEDLDRRVTELEDDR